MAPVDVDPVPRREHIISLDDDALAIATTPSRAVTQAYARPNLHHLAAKLRSLVSVEPGSGALGWSPGTTPPSPPLVARHRYSRISQGSLGLPQDSPGATRTP